MPSKCQLGKWWSLAFDDQKSWRKSSQSRSIGGGNPRADMFLISATNWDVGPTMHCNVGAA